MKIKELAIDRYGAWSKLRLSELDDRLNVIYGANGSSKTTIVRFLQAMLYGFPHFQESAAPAQSSPWGGAITVEGRHGRCIIRRHDDGTRTGRLSVQMAEGAPLDREALSELLSGVDESAYRTLFLASFRDAPATEALIRTAFAHGFDLSTTHEDAPAPRLEDPEDVRRFEEERRAIARLQERRRAVEADLDEGERTLHHLRHRRESELRRLQDAIGRAEAETLLLRRELQALNEQIAAGEVRLPAPAVLAPAGRDDEESEGQTLRRRLHALELQLERWRQVQQDVRRRRERLRREMMNWTAATPDAPVALWDDAQRHIDDIERRLEQLHGEIQRLAELPADQTCNCREADRRCTPLVRAVREEVYRLCREVNRRYLQDRRDAITEELRQLRRCHTEVASHLERLGRRKVRLEREWESQNAGLASLRVRRQEVAERLSRCEAHLARLHDERRGLELPPSLGELESRQAARRREIEEIQRESAARLERLAALENAPRTSVAVPKPAPTVIREASEYLRRLTDGQFVRLRVEGRDRSLWIVDARGDAFSREAWEGAPGDAVPALASEAHSDLAARRRGVWACVHVSLCLALVEGYARRGVQLPLLLDDAFLHLDASQAERLGSLLCEFAGRGHQVLAFTSHEHIARMFRRWDVPVLELPVESALHEQQALRWSGEPTVPPRAAQAEPERDGKPASRHYLHRSDAIQYAPDLESSAANELAAQGVLTVGDFLALSPALVEQRLGRLRMSAESIRHCQAMARLMCDTPRLRAYDARILVASGLTSAEELERLSPEELLLRVEQCLATEEGRRLFRLGDDDELARLASWIGSGRTTQSLRETQKRHWERRRAGERRRWYDEPSTADAVLYGPHRQLALAPTDDLLPRVTAIPRQTPADAVSRSRYYLEWSSPIAEAPSIGPRTAERLRAIGVKTVADLLAVSPDSAARRIDHRRITAATIRDWQSQAELVCSVPSLRGHDAQILVACGVRTAAHLAASDALRLSERAAAFAGSLEGQRILRGGRHPDREEVAAWIANAQRARQPHAA